jgi:O-antigen ligase
MHNLYLQTFVEAGVFGAIFMFLALFYVVYAGHRMLRTIRDLRVRVPVAYLAVGYVVAILAHGFIEAGTTRGSTLNALMLPFALGLFDRIPEMLRGEGIHGEQIEEFDADEYDEDYDEEL